MRQERVSHREEERIHQPCRAIHAYVLMANHPVAYLVTIHCGWMPTFFAMLACRAMSSLMNSVNFSGELPTGK